MELSELLARPRLSGPAGDRNGFTYPYLTSTVLEDGSRWQMSVSGYHIYGYYNSYPATALLWDNFPSANNSTTIDRNKPTIGVSVDGTDELTSDPALDVAIDYQDATSPPWFGSNGKASNWTCLSRGAPCQPAGNPDQACSAAQTPNSRITSFGCQKDVSAQPDGKYYVCAIAADAAVPDKPSGADQFANAYSQNANLSDSTCGWVTLDRQPPTVAAQASATTVNVGQLVTLTASASDPAGLSGGFEWDFGDNTPHGAGATTTHTYTQPGTFRATTAIADSVGNRGTAGVTITVAAATATATDGTSGAQPTTAPIRRSTISQQAGGGGTQLLTFAGLKVIAPKRFAAGKRTAVPLAFTVDTPGRLQVALLKGSRIVAKKGVGFSRAGTFAGKLPVSKNLKAGTYRLRLSFTARGSNRAVAKRLTLKVVRAKQSRHASRATAAPLCGTATRTGRAPGSP